MSERPPAGGGDAAGRLGEQVGRFATLAMRRLEQMASAGATIAEQSTRASASHDAPAPGSVTARAETMVDGASAQVGTAASMLGQRLRRAAALAREEAEDIWAEAQQGRAARRGVPDERPGDRP